MVGRLCHIVFGPHDQNFNDLWNQLRDEHEALIRKGYSGEGFLSIGHKLGGSRIPMAEARRRARVAAQQRQQQQANSGHRLGGQRVSQGQDIRAVIANAAQRRTNTMRGCANGSSDSGWKDKIAQEASQNGFKTKAEEDDANERAIMEAYIELLQEEEQEKYGQNYVPPTNANPIGRRNPSKLSSTSSSVPQPSLTSPCSPMSPPPIPTFSRLPSISKPVGRSPAADFNVPGPPSSMPTSATSYNDSWSCPICTLNNPPTYLCCDACCTQRPVPTRPPETPSGPPSSLPVPKKSSSALGSNVNLQRKSSYDNMARFARAAREAELRRPIGWSCHSCGSFMESQWWTCSNCGAMKQSS